MKSRKQPLRIPAGAMRALPLALAFALAMPSQAAESEYAVKAAYLAKFPFYIEWPPGSLGATGTPITLCVVGDDPFGPLLDEAAAGQQVQGRPLTVKRLKSITRESGCHIAYLGHDAKTEGLRSAPVLLVSDGPASGGTVNFVVRDNRVRFTVDDESAAQSGLAISSKLLAVALSVKSRGSR